MKQEHCSDRLFSPDNSLFSKQFSPYIISRVEFARVVGFELWSHGSITSALNH